MFNNTSLLDDARNQGERTQSDNEKKKEKKLIKIIIIIINYLCTFCKIYLFFIFTVNLCQMHLLRIPLICITETCTQFSNSFTI